jgi:hypothetical protein
MRSASSGVRAALGGPGCGAAERFGIGNAEDAPVWAVAPATRPYLALPTQSRIARLPAQPMRTGNTRSHTQTLGDRK